MALNPLNTDALGILGLEIVHTGAFERGTAIVRRAMELNPNHAGWMHFAPLWDHFHKGEYEQALACANRVDVPGLFWPFLVMASAWGHLGRRAEAAAAVRDLLALDPEFAAHARSNVGTWHFASGLMDPILEGLRKAGLVIPENGSSDSPGNPDLPDKFKGATPALTPQRITIREKSAADIFANLKGITPSYRFREKVEELYLGRWTGDPGWSATVHALPSKLSGGRWFCSLKEVGSGTRVMAVTVQDISTLRAGDSVTVSGRIRDVSILEDVSLEDAVFLSDTVPLTSRA
jgi:hypothetical protein